MHSTLTTQRPKFQTVSKEIGASSSRGFLMRRPLDASLIFLWILSCQCVYVRWRCIDSVFSIICCRRPAWMANAKAFLTVFHIVFVVCVILVLRVLWKTKSFLLLFLLLLLLLLLGTCPKYRRFLHLVFEVVGSAFPLLPKWTS